MRATAPTKSVGYGEDIDRTAKPARDSETQSQSWHSTEFWHCIVICNCNDLTWNVLFWYGRGGVVSHLVCIFCNCAYLKVSLFCSIVRTFLCPVSCLCICGLVNLCCCWFTHWPIQHTDQMNINFVVWCHFKQTEHEHIIWHKCILNICFMQTLKSVYIQFGFSCCISISYNRPLSASLAIAAYALNGLILKCLP